jgi:CRISPR/Cas system-associated exonuclease Cas4 (RecB family)
MTEPLVRFPLGLFRGGQVQTPRGDPIPAVERREPYVYITWLAKVMDGAACQWSYAFQIGHLLKTRAHEFINPEWNVAHTRALVELENEIRGKGLAPEVEYELSIQVDNAKVAGKIDCLVVDDDNRVVTVYEVKTGSPKSRDKLQTQLYMYFLAQRGRTYREYGLRGMLVYPDRREPVDGVPEHFGDDVKFFLDLLIDGTPRKRPGSNCRDCKIHAVDCPERLELESDARIRGDSA